MTIQEIRIGNIIRHNVKDTESETGFCEPNEAPISEDDMWFFCDGWLGDSEPVKLTEEWLAKLGFEGIDEDGLWQRPDNECFQVQLPTLDEEIQHIWDTSFTEAPIEFVHQLQNLYFALTGTELEIK